MIYNRALLKGLCLERGRDKTVALRYCIRGLAPHPQQSPFLQFTKHTLHSPSLCITLWFFPFFCFKSVCPLPLSSPLPSRLVSHLGSRWPAGTVPLEFPASCREIDESEVPWRLQRGLWGGRHGGQAPSNTKQAELMGMLLRKKREERRERCAHI